MIRRRETWNLRQPKFTVPGILTVENADYRQSMDVEESRLPPTQASVT